MSWCGGKIECEIYRDKKYCRRRDHADEFTPCDCRHAKYLCEVEECSMEKNGCGGRRETPVVLDIHDYIGGGEDG